MTPKEKGINHFKYCLVDDIDKYPLDMIDVSIEIALCEQAKQIFNWLHENDIYNQKESCIAIDKNNLLDFKTKWCK